MKRSLLTTAALLTLTTVSAQYPIPMASTGQDFGKAACVDSLGNPIVAIYFENTIDFDPTAAVSNITSLGSVDTALVKYGPSGQLLWARGIGGAGINTPHAIERDANDNIYFAGYFGNTNGAPATADFDPSLATYNLTNTGGWDPCLAKYNSQGNLLWAITLGATSTTTSEERAWDLAVLDDGSAVISGYFNGTYDLNASTTATQIVTSAGGTDGFVARYSPSGQFLWGIAIGGSGDDDALAVAADHANHIYVAGTFSGTTDLDPGPGTFNVTSVGSTDLYIARYSATDGTFQTAIQIGNTLPDIAPPGQLRCDSAGNVYYTGRFRGVLDLDPASTTTLSISNTGTSVTDEIWLASYTPNLGLRWGFNLTSDGGMDGAHRVALDSSGHLYVAGWVSGTTDFDGSAATALVVGRRPMPLSRGTPQPLVRLNGPKYSAAPLPTRTAKQ